MQRRDFLQHLAAAAALPLGPRLSFDRGQAPADTTAAPTLRYFRPATRWVEALPIGNGRLGAMVFGGVGTERLQLNDDTLWSGGPTDGNNPGARAVLPDIRAAIAAKRYVDADALAKKMMGPYTQSYLPMADLLLVFDHGDIAADYRRTLDLRDASATASFRVGDVRYTRTAIASAPAQAIAVRLESSRPGTLRFTARLSSKLHFETAADGDAHILRGRAPAHVDPSYVSQNDPVRYAADAGMRFQVRVSATAEGGRVTTTHDGVRVDDADAVTIVVTAATSFNGYDASPVTAGSDEAALAADRLSRAATQGWPALRDAHVADHRALFDRVTFDLKGTDPSAKLSTDQRIAQLGVKDTELVAQLFQYGRYLLIGSSRPGSQPANLQGIWNDELRAPWSSNYTININTEMNYWPAESANLAELHEPLIDFLGELAVKGARTAAVNYGAKGWVAHHNTDLWRHSAPVGDFGSGDPVWAFWPMGGAWLSQHLYEHYLFGGDVTYLRGRAYPVMRGAAEFLLDYLVPDAQGHLVTSPSTSPENKFVLPDGTRAAVSAGSTSDMALVRDLFSNVIEAAATLGVDASFQRQLQAALERLRPYRIGSKGQLLEWSEEFIEAEPQHRHFSHLIGLHPARHITPRSPELFAAVRRSHELRGDVGTGWSLAWKVNHWARLLDGDRAHALLSNLLQLVDTQATSYRGGGGLYPNLLDAHPPFQIDGNFGVTAGMIEMLVQSHAGEIHLLPALPSAWPSGSIRGIRARGGFEIDLAWSGGAITQATLRSRLGGVARLRTATPVSVPNSRPATGPNPNPFFRLHDPGRPEIANAAAAPPFVPPPSHVIDVETLADGRYDIRGA